MAEQTVLNQSRNCSAVSVPCAPFGGVTVRAMALACALMPLLALWVVMSELVWDAGQMTSLALFSHVTFVVFVVALVNLLVSQRWPRAALTPGEVLTIYIMLSVAATFCSHDLIQILIPLLAYPAHAANSQNRWDQLILSHLPGWAIVTDKDAVAGLAVGNASLGSGHILLAWLKPLSFWFVFLMALMGALLCLNVFFRQPWTEQERLSFPIIVIPMELATGLSRLLTNKLFWLAFGIAASIDIVNGCHHFVPNIPAIPIIEAFKFHDYFVERPWNAINDTVINLFPFAIGLAFFLPTELAFSCWFFFILYRLQLVGAASVGLRDLPGFPFVAEQTAGGYLALGVLAVWLARRHLVRVAKTILGRPGGADESREPLRYRTTLMVLMLCLAVLLVGGVQLGGTWPVLVMFFAIFFLYALATARLRAELGPPAHDIHFAGPEVLMHNAVGTQPLGAGNVGAFSLMFWFNRVYRSNVSAHSMEGFKISQLAKIAARSMMGAMVVAIVVGALAAFWAVLHALYVHGYSGRPAGEAVAQESWNRMAGWLTAAQAPRPGATLATIGGLLFALLLGALRLSCSWWPLHPAGFAIAASSSMSQLWFCIFLAWLAKVAITRYGGAAAYRKALPFFIGLVLGEFTVGSLWGIYGVLSGKSVYHFWI